MVQQDDSFRPELWRRALASEAFAENGTARDRFKRALLDMEEQAGLLASEISREMPEFTQHDISHVHAIWEIADHIAGPELQLNPAEVFVLGGAILVHDLAMSSAAHQVAGKKLRERREWPDAFAREVRRKYGRPPHGLELASPPEELAREADKYLLRSLHAEVAEELPMASWASSDKTTAYLINDPELRQAYGRVMGRVAASHHWDYDAVTRHLAAPVGAPGFAPIDWRIDTLVLACLLRTADAAHLDSKRAPTILAAVRDLPVESRDHWLFQARIQRPYLKHGRLVFTAPDGFGTDEIGAWWLAYETLSAVDEELRNTDSVLSDHARSAFSARGVANVESPKAFSAVAPCRDWEPVEAKVKVDDVAGLVRRLGGSELYGDNWVAGIREIVTNACDAVKAREALSVYRGGRPFAGRVAVWLEKKEEHIWLICSDNGIGMTPSVLGGKLLDFGNTSWLSADVVRGNPGLLASSFEPSGRFGIGFFSIFMAGERVKVTSRSVSGGPAETWILEFSDGVEQRPILRAATPEEQLDEPGTMVAVQLDDYLCAEVSSENAGDSRIFLRTHMRRMGWRSTEAVSLVSVLRYLMLASEVEIWASKYLGGRDSECAVAKQEWVTMDGVQLMRRLLGLPDDGLDDDDSLIDTEDVDDIDGVEYAEEVAQAVGPRLQLVHDADGRPAGRIAMGTPSLMDEDFSYPDASIVTAGPARTSTALRNVCGILLGRPYGAAREAAVPVASYASMGDWVEAEMAKLTSLASQAEKGGWCVVLAEMALRLDRDAKHLPCWRVRDGWIDYHQLVQWISERSEFHVTDPYYFSIDIGPETVLADINEDVLVFELGRNINLTGNSNLIGWPENPKQPYDLPFRLFFGRALSEAWGASAAGLTRRFLRPSRRPVEAGSFHGRPIIVQAFPFVRGEQ
ncbi:HD domain-containing protein [Streptomyces bauhiniae]